MIDTILSDEQLLEDLGDTPDEIATCLQIKGMRGVRNKVRFLNPVIRYLHQQLPDALEIDLLKRDRLTVAFSEEETVEVLLPEPVREFIDAFDAGAYPELESPLS